MSFLSIFKRNQQTTADKIHGKSIVEALNRVQAVIEFQIDGSIVAANANFCELMGYPLEDIIGKHHRIFVESTDAQSQAYRNFWASLKSGKFHRGEYKRIGNHGKAVWVQATYTPIMNENNDVIKVVTFATDVTQAKLQSADFRSQVLAVDRSQAVIEFDLEGKIER